MRPQPSRTSREILITHLSKENSAHTLNLIDQKVKCYNCNYGAGHRSCSWQNWSGPNSCPAKGFCIGSLYKPAQRCRKHSLSSFHLLDSSFSNVIIKFSCKTRVTCPCQRIYAAKQHEQRIPKLNFESCKKIQLSPKSFNKKVSFPAVI